MKKYATSVIGTKKETTTTTTTIHSIDVLKARNPQEAKGKTVESFFKENEGFKIMSILTEEIK